MRLIQFLLVILTIMWVILTILPDESSDYKFKNKKKLIVGVLITLTLFMTIGLYVFNQDGKDQKTSLKMLSNKIVNNKIYLTDENIKYISPESLSEFILKNNVSVIDVYQFNNLNLGKYAKYWPEGVDIIIRDTLSKEVKSFIDNYIVKYNYSNMFVIDSITIDQPNDNFDYLNNINFFGKLTFKNIDLSKVGNDFWNKLLNDKNIKELSLIKCEISDSIFENILLSIKESDMVKLNLWGNHISDASIDNILELFNSSLRYIDLGQNSFSENVALQIMRAFEKSKKVNYLNINNSNLSSKTRKIMSNLNIMKNNKDI